MRYAGQCALEFGFVRPRVTHPRPRASFLAKDYPSSSTDPAWLWRRSRSSILAPGHLAVEPGRPLQGRAGWLYLFWALYGGDGYVYRYVARTQALRLLIVQSLLAPPRATEIAPL